MEETLLITAGNGPRECEYAAKGISLAYMREAKAIGLSVLLFQSDNPGSNMLKLSGPGLGGFLDSRCGTIKWIGQSPYRKNHKRKNWSVGVYRLPKPDKVPELNVKDISYTATRASGPGGQHVNKTNSAVRAIHEPSGLVVTAQEERSQHANKKLCLIKLTALLPQKRENKISDTQYSTWLNHKSLERGNPVRVYKGDRFLLQ